MSFRSSTFIEPSSSANQISTSRIWPQSFAILTFQNAKYRNDGIGTGNVLLRGLCTSCATFLVSQQRKRSLLTFMLWKSYFQYPEFPQIMLHYFHKLRIIWCAGTMGWLCINERCLAWTQNVPSFFPYAQMWIIRILQPFRNYLLHFQNTLFTRYCK